MQHNTELEDGEASCYNKHDDDDYIDLDSLSYIDERIEHVLGHFQKDFEGGVSSEHLGAKFGGYGTFLQTYEYSPSFQSHPKTPQRLYSSPKSTNLHVKAALHNSKAPSNVPPSMRLGTDSHSAQSFHNLKAPSVDDSVKKDTGISSNGVMQKCTLTDDCANKSGNSTYQRTLKLRLKVKSDFLAKKKAAIYSGLGLDVSPSSSMENSPEQSEGMPPVSQETPEESPNDIVMVMISFTIPGGVLISPLPDSLLHLIRKKEVVGGNRPMSSCIGHQEHCSMSTDESDSFVGDGHLLKKRKVRMAGQSEEQLELKHMSGNHSKNDITLLMKKGLGNRTPDHKDFLPSDLKRTPLSSSFCDTGETAEVTGKAFEVSKEVNKDRVKCRTVSIKAVKEDSLESISGQDFDKIEKQNIGNSFMEKVLEHKPEISHNYNSTDLKNNDKYNAFMISKKAEHNAVKCKVDQDTLKRETNLKGKSKFEGKNKSKVDQSPEKGATVAKIYSVGASNNAMVTDTKSAGFAITCKGKMHKTKSLKDNKVRDFDRDLLKGKKLEWKVDGIDPADGPPGYKAVENANLDDIEEQSVNRVKIKERTSGNKIINQLLAGPCVKDASVTFPMAENEPAPEMVPAAAAPKPQFIEDWVCCDSCQKWRLLPMGLKPEQLPEKWFCSMLNWLPGLNQCNISEDETTKAVHALYQMPISEGQNNMQSHASRPATGVSYDDALQVGLNHKKSSSDVMSDQGKKKYGIKEKAMAVKNNGMHQLLNTAKNNAQEYGKNRNLTDSDQQPADSNPMKKSSSIHLNRLNNLTEEKNMPKKENQMNGGDRDHINLKRTMVAVRYRSGTPKKSKIGDVCYAYKEVNPGMDFEKASLNSRNGLLMKSSRKGMRRYGEYFLSEDEQDKLVVPVKKGDQAQFSSDDGSFDVRNSSKKDGSIKKRKLKDRLDDEKHNNTFSLQGDMQHGQEGNASGYRKEKKHRVLNTEAKSVTEGDDKLNREGGMRRVFLSDIRGQMAVGTEVKSIDKSQQPRNQRKNVASHQVLVCFDLSGKDLSTGQLSLAATSSSSKVSGSHKARTNLEDVRGSPVDSVTSSPLRTSNLDKCILAAGDTSVKDVARKSGLSLMSSRKCLDNREEKASEKRKQEIISYDLHPRSHKFSLIENQVEDFKEKGRVQAKKSSEIKHNHLLDGGVDIVEQHGYCSTENGSQHEEKMNKNNQECALSWQKSGKVTSLRVKEKDRRSGSEVSREKTKVLASDYGFSKNSVRHLSSETGKQTELNQNNFEGSVLNFDAPCSTNINSLSQQNLILNFVEENKANPVHTGSRDVKSKVPSSSESEARRDTCVTSRTATGSQKGDLSNRCPGHVSGKGDLTKLVRTSADVSCKVGVNRSSRNFALDRQLTESSPVTTNSSQTAFSILEEARKLKNTADHYKNSGFEFESNETYFKAALKFLHGASLVENCHSESNKLGEMSQMQIYATTAKLFESCANEYEKRQEMAAAALAYKCMEVVYMIMVYCKHSSINRDPHELLSTLQVVSQVESPSSSASDVDNLNNLTAVAKAALCTNTHVANNQVISAQNLPNVVRLLDFTKEINFAMEASRKCQSTFMAANVTMEETRNRDCIHSIRKVVDFSFQDVDELVNLVSIATRSLSCAGLGGARD